MRQIFIEQFFALLRSAICGSKLTEKERNICDAEQIRNMFLLSAKHDIGHLVEMSLKQNGLISKEYAIGYQYVPKAFYRYTRLQQAYESLCKALEKAQIPFLPLKGAVVREYYPEPWMRTSCDIDVLVHEEDLERAVTILSEEYGYTYQGKGSHDISLFTPGKIHIELHYNLIEDHVAYNSANVLRNVWDMATLKAGFSFWYEMRDEMFYLYHISHMAKHVMNGGCGIKPFIDLYILDNLQNVTKEKRDALLKQSKLLTFANVARHLSKIWFAGAEHNSVSRQLQDYILSGGVYGNNENRIAVQQQEKGGRIAYIFSKVFLPYEIIKFHYPILQKYRWLTPIMEVRRWCKIIFRGHLKRTMREIQCNNKITSADATNIKKFIKSIGL